MYHRSKYNTRDSSVRSLHDIPHGGSREKVALFRLRMKREFLITLLR